MSLLLNATRMKLESSNSILGFEQPAYEGSVGWSRYLTLDGEQAYFMGGACDTCAFLFERMGGASRNISPMETADALRAGLWEADPDIVASVGNVLPGGNYWVNLLEITPTLVTPGTEGDYFANEQVELWDKDAFWDLPHHPKTEYYRTPPVPLGEGKRFFEFVVPMFPKRWLSEKTLTAYANRLDAGEKPTALAISVLEVRGPATREEGPEVTEHWCLAHYLLDGHHKTYAASLARKPITLLSFLATAESVATEENVDKTLEVLAAQGKVS
jgi:hypothetical protein